MPTFAEGIILVVYCLVMPMAFVACLAWVIREFRHTSQLALAGISTHGQIVSRRTSVSVPTRGRSYFVSYRFTIAAALSEQILTSEQEVSYKRYVLLEVGVPVEIVYLPNDPEISRLAGTNVDNAARLRAIYYTLLLAMVWLALFVRIIQSVIH